MSIKNKIILIISIVLILILISIIVYYAYKKVKSELFLNVPIVSFPFKNLYDHNHNLLNIILISAPFREFKHEQLYEEYKAKGMYFCGISSYLNFPGVIDNPYEDKFHIERKHDYIQMVSAWLHCFRPDKIPDNLLNSKLPMELITEADLKDTDNENYKIQTEKEYDFMYCCLEDNKKCEAGWQSINRNWDLAKKCLEVMCGKFKLKGLLVGRTNCEFTDKCNGIVKILPFLSYPEFQKEMQKCKFLFVPNIIDASPRIIAEALCYNMPVLVNSNILGGWHNVISGVTGEFFTDENNIIPALSTIIDNYNTYEPRKWFTSNRGSKITGRILAQFLKKCYPNINNKEMQYATITI